MVENRDLTNLDLAGRGWENVQRGAAQIEEEQRDGHCGLE